MTLYQNRTTGEIRDLGSELISAWKLANNPKLEQWDSYIIHSAHSTPPQPDWITFKTTALNSSSLNSILASAYQLVPVAAGSLAPALLLAEQGNITDFSIAWNAICEAVAVSPEAISDFVLVAESCNLPEAFISSLDPFKNK